MITSDKAEGRLWVIWFHIFTAAENKVENDSTAVGDSNISNGSLLQAVSALDSVANIPTASSERMFPKETSFASCSYST